MKLNFNRVVLGLLFAILLMQSSCKPKVPEGFPQKLTPTTVTLLHEGKPVEGAAVSLVPNVSGNFRVLALTDANGTAKLETAVNVYSKSGVPAGTYKVQILTQQKTTIPDLSPEEQSKMSDAEIKAHQTKQAKELADLKKQNPVPEIWETASRTPLKLTVPEDGKNFTIEISDPKTFEQ
ncbi:MAG: carboxypeptidase-like regulatory domain-containing protein [Planctomycetaceae bacterium]|nr:carboxypeptidase-like regulatory domain-containing protein [Planctomycetaceae bacterium]